MAIPALRISQLSPRIRLLLVILLAVVGCTAVVWLALEYLLLPRLEVMLAQSVRREFRFPDDSIITIERGSLADTATGIVPSFYVSSPRAEIDGMIVEQLEFAATGVDFNMSEILTGGKAKLTGIESARLTFNVSDRQLLGRWQGELAERGYTKPVLELDSEGAKLSALKKFKLIGNARLTAKCEFEVDGTNRIRLRGTELELGPAIFGIGRFNAVLTEFVPLVDLGDFRIAVAIDRLETGPGYLHVAAHSATVYDGNPGSVTSGAGV